MEERQLTIENRTKYYEKNVEYIKKLGGTREQSICLQKNPEDKKERAIVNAKTKKIYYGVARRLGVCDGYNTLLDIKTDEKVQESCFGEVYKLYFPPKASEEERNYIAGKVIPLTNYDYKHKQNHSKSDAWKELYIQKFLSDKIVLKGLNPHFSIFYGYFNCENGNIEDYSNKNVLKKMMMHDVLEKLREEYKTMMNIVDKYNFTRGDKNIMNKFRAKIKQIGDEISKYDVESLNNPKYNIISLIELENVSLSSYIENDYYNINQILKFAKKYDSHLIKTDITHAKQLKQALNIINKSNEKTKNELEFAISPAYLNSLVMYSLIFQCIFGIISMNNRGVIHLDLHTDNILMSYTGKNKNNILDLNVNDYWVYSYNGKKMIIPNVGILCKIVDFGLSETLDHFKNKTVSQKGEIGEYVVDKLNYFVFTIREQREVSRVANSIINSFKYANPELLFANMKLFDVVIFLIAIIADVDDRKKRHFQEANEQLKGEWTKYRYELERIEAKERFNELLTPQYRNNLVNIYNYAFASFINLFYGRKMKKLYDSEFDEIIWGIFAIFKETNVDTKDIKIINPKAYVV